ncbi:MAG: T9SS type A sorting domain-containing protein, partial [Ferruginibacter sp.]|nr:T9SS type A sorting domain-containing protein [Ferruginibacter sp.]
IPTLTSKESNYNTTQFYACAMDPTAGSYNLLAGSQDNGSHKFASSSVQNSIEVTGGDGMFCHIDQNQSQYWFTSYVYNNYYRSSNNGGSFVGANSGNTGRFINPTDYDDIANMMYCAKGSNEFLRWENPQTGNTFTTVALTALSGQISAVKVSPNTANRVFFATGGGTLVRADNANTATPVATVISTGLPSAYISCVEVETGNDNHLIVTYTNYGTNSIWETLNGGTNWTNVEGNLPDMPVRWALFNPNNNDQLIIATELGVWSTDDINGAGTIWGSSNTGLANVRIDMLQIRQSDKLVIAATHGRGLYYTGVFAPPAANYTVSEDVIYPGRYVQFNNTSFNATDNAWNFGDGTTSTATNPVKQFNVAGVYNVTLSINSGALSIVKTITVLPKKAIPYLIANGGNIETNANDFIAKTLNGTAWERGTSATVGKNGTNSGANAWITGLTGNYADNSEAYLYGPEFIFSAPGTYNFSFYTKYVVENNYDGLRVEYSLDTGKVWTPLGTTVVTNWYNFANTGGATAFPLNQAFFSGNFSAAFVRKNFDVSFLAGNPKVAFRFAFKSDFTVNTAGVAIDDIEVTGPLNVLPLRVITFDAVKQNKDALLKWNTVNETNVSHFNVERSWDGITFTTLQNVTAQNNTNNSYIFTDLLSSLNRVPGNIIYYRLKSTDINGSFTRSNIVQLKWLNNQNTALSVSPNPFKDFIKINTDVKIKSVQLVGLKGEVIFTTAAVNAGRINLPPFLTRGVYFLKINTDNGVFVEKIIKE